MRVNSAINIECRYKTFFYYFPGKKGGEIEQTKMEDSEDDNEYDINQAF